jgi:hypothetical protein
MTRRFWRACAVVFVFVVLLAGVSQLFTATAAGCPTGYCHGRVCPYIVAPVVCDGGCTYINGCFAACAGAKHCVPSPL